MTDAPETIWTTGNSQTGSWNDSDVRHCPGTEYTRADIAQAKIAELENALAAASGTIAAMRERATEIEAIVSWYGEQVHLFANDTTEKADEADVALDQDGGKRARAVLKPKP